LATQYLIPDTYPTITSAVSNIPTDLSATGVHEVVITSAGTYSLDGTTTISGFSNASNSDYITISGTSSASHFGDFTSGVLLHGRLLIETSWTRVKNLVISAGNGQSGFTVGGVTTDCFVDDVLVKAHATGSITIGFSQGNDVDRVEYNKCISWYPGSTPVGGQGGWNNNGNGESPTFRNCISWGFDYAFVHGGVPGKPCTYINCVAKCDDIAFFTVDGRAVGSNNATNRSTLLQSVDFGTDNYLNVTDEQFDFVDPDNGNFHINNDSVLIGAGTELTSAFTTDIDGTTISQWPIGVDYNSNVTVYFVGTTKTFSTITSAIENIPSNLSGNGIQNIIVDAETYIETINVSDFSNASSADYIQIRAKDGDEHLGITNSGVVVSGSEHLIGTDFTKVKNIEIIGGSESIINVSGTSATFDKLLLQTSTTSASGILVTNGGSAKCIVISVRNTSGSIDSTAGFNVTSGSMECLNCVSYNFSYSYNGIVATNSIGYANSAGAGIDFSASNITKCASRDGTGTSGFSGLTDEQIDFVGATSGNFHLGEDSILVHEGTNLSADFTTDIDGDTIEDGYPIGIDHNKVWYVDLGNDVNITTGSVSGVGSQTSPINGKAWYDRVRNTGGIGSSDTYIMKGIGNTASDRLLRYAKIKGWDSVSNGPWAVEFASGGTHGFGSGGSINLIEDGIIKDASGTHRLYTSANNCLFLLSGCTIDQFYDETYKGCTFDVSPTHTGTGSSTIVTYENCILRTDWSGGAGSNTLNLTNCVITEADDSPSNYPGFGTVNATGCQFSYSAVDSLPDYNDTDFNLFKVDSAVTINAELSATSADAPTGLFGNARPTDNEFNKGAGMGASFFPLQKLVDVGGSKDFTSIQTAINDVPDDLSTFTGFADVIVCSGTYNESLDFTGFTSATSADYVQVRATSGHEHNGIFDSNSVIIVGTHGDMDWFRLKDLQFNFSGMTTLNNEDLTWENILIKQSGTDTAGTSIRFTSGHKRGKFYKVVQWNAVNPHTSGRHYAWRNWVAGPTPEFYNCSCYGFSRSFFTGSSSKATNCVAHAGDRIPSSQFVVGPKTACASDDGTGSTGFQNITSADIDFVGPTSGDLHIGKDSILHHNGSSTVSAEFTDDIDGTTISADRWPIGIDFDENLHFVDLDAVVSGTGSKTSPFDPTDFKSRVDVGGTGNINEVYKVRGDHDYGAITFNFRLASRVEAWDLSLYGPWRLRTTTSNPNRIYFDGPDIADGIFETWRPQHAKNVAGTVYYNSYIKNTSTFEVWDDLIAYGSTFISLFYSGGTNDLKLTDCILRGGVSQQAGGGPEIINYYFNNFATGSSRASFFATDTDTIVEENNVQYDVSFVNSAPSWSSTISAEFAPDPAITLSGTGDYTDYEKGLFGKLRSTYESETGKIAIGASYFNPPPAFENGTPLLSNYMISGADVIVQTDVTTSAYMVAVAYNDTAPTIDEIIAGQESGGSPAPFAGSVALTPSTSASITISGLAPDLYDVYTVAQASDTLTSNSVKLLLDIQVPSWSAGYPFIGSLQTSGFDIHGKIDEDGHFYAVVVTSGASSPTATEVKNGQASGGGSPLWSGDDALVSGVDNKLTTSGLSNGTYDVYVVAEDNIPNLQTTPVKLTVKLSSGGLNVTATYRGQSVTIVSFRRDGGAIYVTYIDASGNMYVDNISDPASKVQVATSATAQ